jgi:hypothetical protein
LATQAHRALATWEGFPGFVADLDVSRAGKTAFGRVVVEASGRVFIEHLCRPDARWVKTRLACLIRQQLLHDEVVGKEWKFVPGDGEQLGEGRALVRTDQPLDRCVWICNRQLAAVQTRTPESKTTASFLAFQTTPSGKTLPGVVALHVWNAHTGELKTTEIQARSWVRIRDFDLPEAIDVLSVEPASGASRQVRSCIRLSNHRLLASANPLLADK